MTGDHQTSHQPAAPLPSEADWLHSAAELPADALPAPEFASRVLAALADERRQAPCTRAQLDAFAPPPPAPDFVAQATAKVLADRRERWREALLRHDTPEPSPEFVARTLRALAADRELPPAAQLRRLPAPPHRATHWLVLAAAAAAIALVWTRLDSIEDTARPPLQARSAAFAHAHAGSALPELLVRLEADFDGSALPAVAADGRWLAEARR